MLNFNRYLPLILCSVFLFAACKPTQTLVIGAFGLTYMVGEGRTHKIALANISDQPINPKGIKIAFRKQITHTIAVDTMIQPDSVYWVVYKPDNLYKPKRKRLIIRLIDKDNHLIFKYKNLSDKRMSRQYRRKQKDSTIGVN